MVVGGASRKEGTMRTTRSLRCVLGLLTAGWCGVAVRGQSGEETLPTPRPATAAPVLAASILDDAVKPIDLASALKLADVDNPEMLLARQRVAEAVALRQLAAVWLLPTINVGTNLDTHRGNLQQST